MRSRSGAVCVRRYSLQPKSWEAAAGEKNNNNNRELGLSAERQGLFSGRRAATHQGHAAVIPQEEMLEIPNSGDGLRRWRYERGGSWFSSGFACGFFFFGRGILEMVSKCRISGLKQRDEEGIDKMCFVVLLRIYFLSIVL